MIDWNPIYRRARQIAFLAKHRYLDLYILDGTFQGSSLRMLVADDGSTLPYIRDMAFPDGVDIGSKGKISALKAPELAESGADVVVVGANCLLSRLYTQRGFHLVPKWLNPVFPTTEDFEVTIDRLRSSDKKNIKRDIRRVKEGGYSWKLTTDPAWFDEFYHRMYKPSAIQRYGELTQLDGYQRVKRAFDKGTGIIIEQNGEAIAGSLVYIQDHTLRTPYKGMKDGDDAISRAGASQAIYYFAIQLAYSWGCTGINFGSTRAFLSDGPLRYKLRLGTHVVEDELCTAMFAIATPGYTESAQKFLDANHFFELSNGKLRLYQPLPVPEDRLTGKRCITGGPDLEL